MRATILLIAGKAAEEQIHGVLMEAAKFAPQQSHNHTLAL